MPYKILAHTADLRIKVSGKSLEELFNSAAEGMMAVLKNKQALKGSVVKRKVNVESINSTALLVDFLNEMLVLTQTYKEIYTDIYFDKLDEQKVSAILKGVKTESFDEDIKAVTYHEADVKKNKKGEWETTLIFDI